ncbi:MAG TPA: hypothetical protein VMW12_13665 [Candidatus Dormibacteraeota bacterium]|nr:hypothetical protein [Candidatus Dormibacteraeota bacterium]
MNPHDVVSLIVAAVAVIGVISTIGSSAQKARDKRRQTLGGVGMAAPTVARPPVAPVPQRVARAYAQRLAASLPSAPPPISAVPVPPVSVSAPPITAPAPPPPIVAPAPPPPIVSTPRIVADHGVLQQPSLRTGVLRGLFEDRRNLVRAVVAMEVLGPPIALREQAPWTLQPSEPST